MTGTAAATPPIPHGTVQGYNKHGCRQPCCRQAIATYKANWHRDQILGKPRTTNATGTRRRLRALAVQGYSSPALGKLLGCSETRVRELQNTAPGRAVTTAVAEKVTTLYDKVSMVVPTGHPRSVGQARERALAAGWVGVLGWDDDDLDDPNAKPRVRRRSKKRAAA